MSSSQSYSRCPQMVADAVRADVVLDSDLGEGLAGAVQVGCFLGLLCGEGWWSGVDTTCTKVTCDRIAMDLEPEGQVVDGGAGLIGADQLINLSWSELTGCSGLLSWYR